MKIVVADPLPDSALDILRAQRGWTVDAQFGRKPDVLKTALADSQAIIVRSATKVDASLLAAAPHLRIVARAGSGIDGIDIEAATARGLLVVNTPGINSVSVAEHACALMLALARSVAGADAAMKAGRWEKRTLIGEELRGKTLGVVGLGRIGQEVASRAAAFGMHLVAHDTFISEHVAASLNAELLSLDELCRRADYITLHVPSTPATLHLFNAERLALCRRGVRVVNTARGDLIDGNALADAIESGHVAGAGLDVFETEPPTDWRLARLPQVVATPHIAGSTIEAQEQVGLEIATVVRDFLREGAIRNAVNMPAVGAEELARLRPFLVLAQRLGVLVANLAPGRTKAIRISYQGALAEGPTELIASSVLLGTFSTMLSEGVTVVNARALAGDRGIEVIESRSSRPKNFTNLISVTLETSEATRCAIGTVFEGGGPRLVQLDDIGIEAPLDGTILVLANSDQPGVIGEVGTILGRHGVNIASFSLGRDARGAIGVVSVDERGTEVSEALLDEVRAVKPVRTARVVRFGAPPAAD